LVSLFIIWIPCHPSAILNATSLTFSALANRCKNSRNHEAGSSNNEKLILFSLSSCVETSKMETIRASCKVSRAPNVLISQANISYHNIAPLAYKRNPGQGSKIPPAPCKPEVILLSNIHLQISRKKDCQDNKSELMHSLNSRPLQPARTSSFSTKKVPGSRQSICSRLPGVEERSNAPLEVRPDQSMPGNNAQSSQPLFSNRKSKRYFT
jgi:hypothetical protein